MSNDFDVIIVGAGIIGASLFYYLSKMGKSILLLEKEAPCNGSTGRSGGFIRCFQNTLDAAKLSHEGYLDYLSLSKELNAPLTFHNTGIYLIEARQKYENLKLTQDYLKKKGINIALFSYEEYKREKQLMRNIQLNEDELLIYEEKAGRMNAIDVTLSYMEGGRKYGGIVLNNHKVTRLLQKKNKIEGVATNNGLFYSPCVVMSAGSWSADLLSMANIKALDVHNKIIRLYSFDLSDKNVKLTPFLDTFFGFYGWQESDTLNLGLTKSESLISDLDKLKFFCEQRFPPLKNFKYKHEVSAIEAYTDNAMVKTGFSPEIQGLFSNFGWSGVGFKFAPICNKKNALEIVSFLEDRKYEQ